MSVTTDLRNNKKALLHSEKYRKLSLKPQRGGEAIHFFSILAKIFMPYYKYFKTI